MQGFFDWLSSQFGISEEDFNKLPNTQQISYTLYFQKLKSAGKLDSNPVQDFQQGNISAIDFQGALSGAGINLTPESTQWLNNEVSQQVTGEERDYNTYMRDSSYTSAADQLSSLGLNPASVISTGGAGIGNTGAVADTSKGNPALEKALNTYQQRAALTRSLVGIIGGLGSAGIFGGTRLLAQKAAMAAASATASSGLNVLKKGPSDPQYDSISAKDWNKLLKRLG